MLKAAEKEAERQQREAERLANRTERGVAGKLCANGVWRRHQLSRRGLSL